MSISRCMDKENVVYIHNGSYSAMKKEWNIAICSHMDGPKIVILSEVSKKQKQKTYNITYMWNLKYDTNEFT